MVATTEAPAVDCGLANPAAGWLRCGLLTGHEGAHVGGSVRWERDERHIPKPSVRVRDWWRASSPEAAQAIVATLTLHGLRCDVLSRAGLTRVVVEHGAIDRDQVARLVKTADLLAIPVAERLGS